MLKTAFKQWFCVALFFLVGTAFAQQEQQSTASAANEFVQQVLSKGGMPSSVAVTFQNVSSLSPDAQESLQNTMFNALRNANVRLVKPEQAVVEVQITFSEDWQGYVWVANVQQGSTRQLVIKKLPRQQRSQNTRTPTLTIRKIPVWQQENQILDFFQDNQNLILLEPEQISLYTSDSGQWKLRHTLGIPHDFTWPRDLRGRLEIHGNEMNAFLPGVRCSGRISSPSLDCHSSDDPWPLDPGLVAFYSPRRNFFSGLLAGQNAGASVPAFFSGVSWQNADQRLWLFTGTDGRVRLFQNTLASPAVMFNGWGSTLAAVHSGCGSGWQLLTSSPADTTRADSVQAIEVTGHDAAPVSSPVDVSGSVQALWTAGNYDQVVNGVLQLQSGKYEAFTLAVICNQ